MRELQIHKLMSISDISLVLHAEQVCCVRAERLLFSNINFSVKSGQALIVKGPNGVGKSSLLRIIAGLLRATEGVIKLKNIIELKGIIELKDLPSNEPSSHYIHYLGHKDGLREALTARENLVFLKSLLKQDYNILTKTTLDIEEALEATGVKRLAELPVGVLSAGQKRRVALAGLLICDRPVWVLDEPTTALDLDGCTLFAKLVANHCEAGGIVIAATHLLLNIAAQELMLTPPVQRTRKL